MEPAAQELMLLDGLRALDLTGDYGAFAARVLADLGADVVRVTATPEATDDLGALHRNAGKQLLVVDPASSGATAVVDGLVAGADLVFTSAHTAATWPGCDAEALHERHPHAVVVSVTPWGRSGPAADWSATELVAQAAAGVVYRSGVPELPPVAAPGRFAEDGGAAQAALAGLLGVWHVRHGGSGQVIDLSTILAVAQCTEMALPLWSMLRTDQVRQGAGAYPLYECTDGLARIVLPMTPGEWRALIAWLGAPPEWEGPEWELPLLGPEARATILAVLPARFAAGSRAELAASGDAAGVRITPVLTPHEVLTNEHMAARQTFTPVPMPDGTEAVLHAGAHHVDGRRARPQPAAPLADAPAWPSRPGSSGLTDDTLPFAGLRVLEVGTGVAAPEATRWLASWGADVVKLETAARPDFQRRVLGSDMNPAFATVARDKRVLAADLTTDAGRALLDRLLPHVDVLVENNATGVIDRLGLGWDHVHALNPRLVMVSTQLYGDQGPWADRKGYGPSARAVGGLTWLWAHAPDAPRGVMTIHPDHLAGRFAALGAIAGLLARDRTGTGTHISVAQCETVSLLLGELLAGEHVAAGSALPQGNVDAAHAPWGLYRARDDGSECWLAVTVTDDSAWQRLVTVAPTALDRPAWRTEAARVADRAELDSVLAAWIRDSDGEALERELQRAGVAASRVLHPRLHADHPHFLERGFVVEVDQPGNGPLLFEGPCFAAPALAKPRDGAAPLPGAHTLELLRDVLGCDDTEIAALVAAGAVEPPPEWPVSG